MPRCFAHEFARKYRTCPFGGNGFKTNSELTESILWKLNFLGFIKL